MKYKVDHILVQHLYEAEDLLKQLQDGKDFESLATKYSQCPSGKSGGSLGLVSIARLDTDFAEALELLKPGQISKKPVRTKFGYHIIRRQFT